MQRALKTLSRELFTSDASGTRGYRLHVRAVELFLVAYAAYFCWDWGFYVQRNITEVLLPLGIAQYIDVSFLFDNYLAVANAALVTLFGALGFFRIGRGSYAIAFALFHLQYTARYSLGEISHGSNLVGMGILALALTSLFFADESNRRRFTMGFLYFFIGLGYTSAAVCKLVATGITWVDGHHLLLWIAERKVDTISKFGAFDPNLLQEMILVNYHWGTAALLFGLVAESLSFLMWWRRFRYPIVMLVVTMHFGILVTMNIFFAASTYLLILLALPWPWLLNRLFDQMKEASRSAAPPARADWA